MAETPLSTLGGILKATYESETDTNAFTDTEKSKLAGVATGAQRITSGTVTVDTGNYTFSGGSDGDVLTRQADGSATWEAAPGAGGGVTDGDKGDITVTSSGTVWTVDDEAITNAKLAHVATATIKGRATASTGDPEDLTAAQVRTIINVEDGATADQTGAEIKTALFAESDTNNFDDAAQTKLTAIDLDVDYVDIATSAATTSAMNGKAVRSTGSGSTTLTVAENTITRTTLIYQQGTGQVNVVAGSNVTVLAQAGGTLFSNGQNALMALVPVSANVIKLTGETTLS